MVPKCVWIHANQILRISGDLYDEEFEDVEEDLLRRASERHPGTVACSNLHLE
jgi:hypothetical protein